ncbi:helix-turn-helix domain-containing protein [soil metagenome]
MYVLRTPAEPLRRFIEHYWFVSHAPGEDVDLRVDVFVDARADLIFNFDAPYRREVIGGTTAHLTDSNLDAQRLVPIRIVQHGRVQIAGVRFQLGGLAPFAQSPLAQWTGLTPAPELVLGPAVGEVETALRNDSGPDAAAAILDTFFLAQLTEDDRRTTFEAALRSLRDGRSSVSDLAEAAGVSGRQVERLFAQYLGIPPKTVGRIVRFQGALQSLMADPGCPLGDIAAESGYYDQAHFIRDFRLFSGGVPRGYRGYYPPDVATDFAPNVVVFVQDEGGPPPRD